MGRLPDPPAGRRTIKADIVERRISLYRIFTTTISGKRASPIYFGNDAESRFDDPRKNFGVIYAALSVDGAFVETLGRGKKFKVLRRQRIERKSLACISSRRALRWVDLSSKGLRWAGLDARIASDDDYAQSQKWSRCFHDHPERPDGILYRSRHDPAEIVVAIYERAARALVIKQTVDFKTDLSAIMSCIKKYDFALAPAGYGRAIPLKAKKTAGTRSRKP